MTRDPRAWLQRSLFAMGMGLCILWLAVWVVARTFQAHENARLEGLSRRDATSLEVATETRREAAASGLVGRIELPRLGIHAIITEGTSERGLLSAVGHVEHTRFPGEPGNVGLAGHRDTYFRNLERVAPGDEIRIHTPDGTFQYAVDSVLIVKPDRVDLLADTDYPALTLVTCYPFHWIGPAPKRFVVRASRVRMAGKPGTLQIRQDPRLPAPTSMVRIPRHAGRHVMTIREAKGER